MSDFKKQIQQGLEAYSQKTVLRAVINAIPWVGGSIDVLLSSNGQKIIEHRIRQLFENLKDDLSEVKEAAVDKNFLETGEFFDLMRKAIESSVKTRDQEKIRLYARILKNSILKTSACRESAEDYLSALSELSVRELNLAKAIYGMQSAGSNEGENELQMARRTGWDNLSEKVAIPRGELDFLLKRLERTGLIKEITGGYFDYSGGVYVITDSFSAMMEYLETSDGA